MINVYTLRVWSERICGIAEGGRESALRLFGLAGNVVRDREFLTVRPPPDGATALRIYGDVAKSELAYIELDLAPPGLMLSSLKSTFGRGEELARTHSWSTYRVAYHVPGIDTPFSCDVIAELGTRPTPASRTTQLVLRRSYARHA
jgi:hypothetical protein